jgi:hypothetical protein
MVMRNTLASEGVALDWTDDQWRAFRNYADSVRIDLNFVEHPSAPSVEEWVLSSRAANWDQDWLIKQVEQLANDPETGPLYVLQIKETHFSWGADAAALQILLDLSVGLLGAAIWDSAKALTRSLGDRLADADAGEPLTEEELVGRARLIVSERYDLEDSQLTTVSVEIAGPDTGTVRLRGSDGQHYELEMYRANGLVHLARIKRTEA